jgi:predicted Zn finger-like uncharacterized protein
MAARMTPSVDHEKQGNTSWVRCPSCEQWFPVSNALLDADDVPMHCPGCHREFAGADAGRIVRAG